MSSPSSTMSQNVRSASHEQTGHQPRQHPAEIRHIRQCAGSADLGSASSRDIDIRSCRTSRSNLPPCNKIASRCCGQILSDMHQRVPERIGLGLADRDDRGLSIDGDQLTRAGAILSLVARPGAAAGILRHRDASLFVTQTTFSIPSLVRCNHERRRCQSANSILLVTFAREYREQTGMQRRGGRDQGRRNPATPGADDGGGDVRRPDSDGARDWRRAANRTPRWHAPCLVASLVGTCSTLLFVPFLYAALLRTGKTVNPLKDYL